MNLQPVIRAAVCAALIVAILASAGRFTTSPVTGQETKQQVLHGAAALERLKQDGQYDSLQAAMNQARFSVSRVEQTPLGRSAWHAPNPAAGYDAYVTEAGVSIAVNDKTSVSLSLSGIGYGEALQSIAPGAVSGDKQTINIARAGGLQEWYVNGPDGVEQGFTLSQPPAARQKGMPLRLALQVSEGWRAVASDDGKLVNLSGPRDETVEYSKLVVRDKLGRNIAAQLTVADEQVVIEAEDHDAAYPLTIDPVFTLPQKLTAADGAANDYLGYSVALDGDTALVGAPYDDAPGAEQGSAYVFVRNGVTWTQQAKLTAQDGSSNDYFGYSVALKGNLALVGAIVGPGISDPNQGAVYVFERSGSAWTQQARLNANEILLSGANFGAAVALDGDTALVGAPNYTATPSYAITGAVYVFTRNGATWTQQARLLASDADDNDSFGRAVALDGDTALIGAPNNSVTVGDQGSAYIFKRNGATWTQRQRLVASNGAVDDLFGNAVALSGETALIGAYLQGANDQGRVYVFERQAAGWTETTSISAEDYTPGAHFGASVGLDGNMAVVGASLGFYQQGVDQRSAYVFVRNGNYWGQARRFGPGLGSANDGFGYAVALDGDTALVGAYLGDANATDQGAAYVFTLRDSRSVEQQKLTASDGGAGEYFGAAIALDGDTLAVGVFGDAVGANGAQGSVYVFTRNGASWALQQKLTADDGAAGDIFGLAVALDGDTLVAGAQGDDINGKEDQGSAYIFARNGATWTQRQKLKAIEIDGLPGDQFGASVAISGGTVAVGATGASNHRGSVYVYTLDGAVWKEQAKLWLNYAAEFDAFGYAIALDGDTLAVGVPGEDIGANDDQGSVYVFTRNGATWTQSPKLIHTYGEAGDYFGSAVALDGDALAVGAFRDNVGENENQGAVYVFSRSGGIWSYLQALNASDGAAGDQFGFSLALDGASLAVGAWNDTVGASSQQGSAYLFTYIGGQWRPQQKLTAGDGAANDRFGVSVALSGDTLAIGAYRDAIGANTDQGSVYVFVHPPCHALAIAPNSLPNGVVGAPYNQQFTVSNDDDAELNVTMSKGELPPGLTLDNNTGQLSGTPTATGTYRFTITITFYLSGCGASRDYALTITAPLCSNFTLNPVSQSFSSRASTGSVQVKAGVGCAWTATSNASWLTITRGAKGIGDGQVVYQVAPNFGAARQAVVAVAGQRHVVQQAAAGRL